MVHLPRFSPVPAGLRMLPVAALALLFAGLGACGDGSSATHAASRLPEEELVYAISNITVNRHRQAPMKAAAEALDILREIQHGKPFAEVARERSEDKESAPAGGFQGFWMGSEDEALSGGINAVPIGAVSGLIESPSGIHLIHRHTFEEGRALEAEHVVATYGFLVPWADSKPPAERTREEAEALVRSLMREIDVGTKTLATAYEAVHGEAPPRQDLFIRLVRDDELDTTFYNQARSVAEGAWLPVTDLKGGLSLTRRGPLLRTIVRQILIQHVGSKERMMAVHRTKEEARRLAERVLGEVAADGSNWRELVTRYSDDAMSQPLAGFIGCIANGSLVPPLEMALFETPVGAIHDAVIETPRGFHILYRMK